MQPFMKPVVTEGYMPFKGYQTYYRIVGDIEASYGRGQSPLVLMHGGPGSTHNYFELLDPLAESGRAIIMYDQIGCGNSFVDSHPELWVKEIWVEELKCLREYLKLPRIHLLGQSWGGMLAITYLCDEKPEGIRSVILSSTLSSSQLWGKEQHRQIRFMSEEDQAVIRRAEESGNYSEPDFLSAVDRFMERHCAPVWGEGSPEPLLRKKRSGKESYEVAWGPNEFSPLGTLKTWDYTDKLRNIKEPALVISGTNDLSTPLISKTMADHLPNSRWELFDGCRHMCFAEDTPKYLSLVEEWMREWD